MGVVWLYATICGRGVAVCYDMWAWCGCMLRYVGVVWLYATICGCGVAVCDDVAVCYDVMMWLYAMM